MSTPKEKLFSLCGGFLLILGIGGLDYVTGVEISISIFFLIPISLVAWFAGRDYGVLASLVSAVAWLYADLMADHRYSYALIPYWNSAVRLGFFLVTTITLSRLKKELEVRKDLIRRLQDALEATERTEKELVGKTRKLVHSNNDLQQYASVVAHDLRSPLSVVGMYLHLIQRRVQDRRDEESESIVGLALDGVRRMDMLIKDLLAYSSVGMAELSLADVDLNEVFARVIETLGPQIRATGATVSLAALPTSQLDSVKIVQLFQNLVENSLKFRGKAPPVVAVSAEENEEEWLISVRDNGIGVPESKAEEIFGMFKRGHDEAGIPGTGIGLAICKRVVERHGGRIWFDSLPGRGTTFSVVFPKRAAAAA